ncbi:MAG: trypsin-like serine protease [Chthoniobacterales bacterium]
MPRTLAAILLFVASLAPHAEAGVRRDDVADVNFVNLGADPLYAPVGRFLYSVGASSYIASGVLISPDWVLTAGHVVQGSDFLGGGVTGMNFTLFSGVNSFVYSAAQWIPHPGWAATSGNVLAGFDIGLVRLSTSVSGFAPATLYPQDTVAVQAGTIVGFGATGTGLTGFQNGTAGTKRAGQNMIDATGDGVSISSNILFVDFDRPGVPAESVIGSTSPLALEYLSAPGDSGGGLFITEGVNTYLLGITSFGWGYTDGVANSDYGDLAGFTSVRSFQTWIETTTAVPEPGTWAAAAFLVVAAGALRYRRNKG